MPYEAGTAYAVQADLAAVGLPSDFLAAVPGTTQDAHLLKASGWLDSYARGRFAVPFATWDDAVVEAVAVRAGYTLLAWKGYDPEDEGSKGFLRRYDEILAWVEGLRDGDVTPNVTDSGTHVPAPQVVSDPPRGWGDITDPDDPTEPGGL